MITYSKYAALLLTAMLSSSMAAEPVRYRFEQIPTFDEPNTETFGLALAINELGEVVGIADDESLVARGFLYTPGLFLEIPGFDTGLVSHPRAINQFGDVAGAAGYRVTSNGHTAIVSVPFIRGAGQGIRSILNGEELSRGLGGMAYTINDAGMVAFEGQGAQVRLANGERLNWGFADGGVVTTGRINQFGVLVGTGLRVGSEGFEAMRYDVNSRTAMSLHDPNQARMSFAIDINNAGIAVGDWVRRDNNRTVPVIWRNGSGEELPFINEHLFGWTGHVIAINDRGDVLGESSSAGGQRIDWVLFAGETTPLPLVDLIEGPGFDGYDEFMAFDINNSREISGAAIVRDAAHPLGSTNKPGVLAPLTSQAPAFPAPGLWADLSQPGAGFEINRVGDRHYLIWTTYDASGLPVWYFSQPVRLTHDGWRANLLRFRTNPNGDITSSVAGQAVLSHRRPTEMLFSWRLGEQSGTLAHQYLAGRCEAGARGHTGTWHDPARPGFGLSLLDLGERQAGVFYFYDQNGHPRWVFLHFPTGPGQTEAWLFHGGACPSCPYRPPQRSTIGAARLGLAPGEVELEVNLAGSGSLSAMRWQSAGRMARIPSAPRCDG